MAHALRAAGSACGHGLGTDFGIVNEAVQATTKRTEPRCIDPDPHHLHIGDDCTAALQGVYSGRDSIGATANKVGKLKIGGTVNDAFNHREGRRVEVVALLRKMSPNDDKGLSGN